MRLLLIVYAKFVTLDQVEDELHFILICPMFDELRRRYIAIESITNPTVDIFYIFFVYYALQRRREFLTL